MLASPRDVKVTDSIYKLLLHPCYSELELRLGVQLQGYNKLVVFLSNCPC
jgi:hypothetical protein